MVVIGINSGGLGGETQAMIQSFVAQTQVTFPIVQDPASFNMWETSAAISPFPLDVVVDRSGIIRHVFREYDADTLEAAVVNEL